MAGVKKKKFLGPFSASNIKWRRFGAPEITVYNVERVFAGIVTINKSE